MAETRTIYQEEKMISDVLKKLNTDSLPKNTRLLEPYCVGYNDPAPVDARTKAIMQCGIERKRDGKYKKVELFLSVKGPGALDAWLNVRVGDKFVNKEYIEWLKSQGVTVTASTDHLDSAEYKKAEQTFNESILPKLLESAEKTAEKDLLEKDVAAAKKRPKLKLLSEEIIRAHVIQDTKYVISWLDDKEKDSEQLFTIVLHEAFFNLMFNAVQHAADIGYRAKSLVLQKVDAKHHFEKLEQQDVPSENLADKDHLHMVMHAAKTLYADPADAGKFFGSAVKTIFSSGSSPIPVPVDSKRQQKKHAQAPHSQFFSGTSPAKLSVPAPAVSFDTSSSEELTPNPSPVVSSANSSDDELIILGPSSSPPRDSSAPMPSSLADVIKFTALAPRETKLIVSSAENKDEVGYVSGII